MSIPIPGASTIKLIVIGLIFSMLSGFAVWYQYQQYKICELEKDNLVLKIESTTAHDALGDKTAIDGISDDVSADVRDDIAKGVEEVRDINDDVADELDKLRSEKPLSKSKPKAKMRVEEISLKEDVVKMASHTSKPAATTVVKVKKRKVSHEDQSFNAEYHRAASRIIVNGMWKTYCGRISNDGSCSAS